MEKKSLHSKVILNLDETIKSIKRKYHVIKLFFINHRNRKVSQKRIDLFN